MIDFCRGRKILQPEIHSFTEPVKHKVMTTKDNISTKQSRPVTIPTGKESKIPVSQPSGLGELATSMVIEADKRLEVVKGLKSVHCQELTR